MTFYEIVRLYVNEVKRGRTNIENAPRPEALKSAVTLEIIDKNYSLALGGINKNVRI